MEGNGIFSTEEVPYLLILPLSYNVGHPQAERKSMHDSQTMYVNIWYPSSGVCRYFVLALLIF